MAVNCIIIVSAQPVAGARLGRLTQRPRHAHATVLACGTCAIGPGFGLTSLASATWQYAACVAVWTCGEILTSIAGTPVIALGPAIWRRAEREPDAGADAAGVSG